MDTVKPLLEHDLNTSVRGEVKDEREPQAYRSMNGLDGLREQGGMIWVEHGRGWIAAPATVLNALVSDGFEECKREMTTSRRDSRSAGGLWQGINPRTSSVASVIWVARPAMQTAMMFIEIDGESVTRTGRDPDEEEGGEA